MLSLHVAVVPAMRLQPAADPLFILSGGPGQAASDYYLSIGPAFARIRRDRDIVLVDQRGTGRSNRLDCRLPEGAELARLDAPRLRAALRACLATLPGDPRQYTTSIAVRDLEEVRAALGYQRINLYGVSYGTRVAQHYLRRHPQRVRTVILDGVVPPQLALGPQAPLDAQRALDAVFARCSASEPCRQAFPQIARTFVDLREQLERQPLTLSVPDPLDAQQTTISFGASELAAAVRLLSYVDETTSILPLLIHEAQVRRRPEALAAQYLIIKREVEAQIASGMHYSVVCSEDAPRWQDRPLDMAALERTYMGTAYVSALGTICAEWPRGPVDEDFHEPLRSDVPVLVLSGGNDPVTPERYGRQIMTGLRHARHLVLTGQGHGQIAIGCVPRLAARFIAAGSAAALDVSCIETISPAPFMLSSTATAP